MTHLQSLMAEVNQRRDEIRHLEKKDIGRINAKMDVLRLQQRALERAQPAGIAVPEAQLSFCRAPWQPCKLSTRY